MSEDESLVKEIPKGLIKWYDFSLGSYALYIGNDNDPLFEALCEKGLQVKCISTDYIENASSSPNNQGVFDYIVAITCIEKNEHPSVLLQNIKRMLKENGILLIGMNNRLGLRYFCGDRDIYTKRSFDGIENYQHVNIKQNDKFNGRVYSHEEISSWLRSAKLKYRFFSVLTDLENPSLIYAENVLPNEDLANRVFPTYNYPYSIFLEEETIYSSLVKNGLFHILANAYLIECTIDGSFTDINQVTCSLDRGRRNALFTIIRNNTTVEKYAVYPDGESKLREIANNLHKLRKNGLKTVDGILQGNKFIMPYIEAENGQLYLKRLLLTEKKDFISAMDYFQQLILQSSPHIKEDIGAGNGCLL